MTLTDCISCLPSRHPQLLFNYNNYTKYISILYLIQATHVKIGKTFNPPRINNVRVTSYLKSAASQMVGGLKELLVKNK